MAVLAACRAGYRACFVVVVDWLTDLHLCAELHAGVYAECACGGMGGV